MATLKVGDVVTSLQRHGWVGEVISLGGSPEFVVVEWRSASGTLLHSQRESVNALVLVTDTGAGRRRDD